jgi:hypothetical protein
MWFRSVLRIRICSIRSYVFRPPGSASGSVSYKYGSVSGSGSFHHQAKIVRNTLISTCFETFFMTFYLKEWCKCTSVLDSDPHPDLYVFGPPGSASGSVSQSYGFDDPDPHPGPYQSVTDTQHWFRHANRISSLIPVGIPCVSWSLSFCGIAGFLIFSSYIN